MGLRAYRIGYLVLLAMALLAMAPFARATDPAPVIIERQFGAIDRAVLKLVPPPEQWRFDHELLESDLRDFACEYELHGDDSTAPLRALLNSTQFTEDRSTSPEFGILIGIYLTGAGGKATKLLFAQSADNGSARGMLDGRRVVASWPFERDLRKLVAAMAPSTVRYTCEANQ